MPVKNTDAPTTRGKLAHQRLFGVGAKLSAPSPEETTRVLGRRGVTEDEVAMALRPRSESYKRDVALPRESKGRRLTSKR